MADEISKKKEKRKAGRPEHQPTEELRRNALLLLGQGLSVLDAARALGIAEITMRKHYSAEIALKQQLIDENMKKTFYQRALKGSDRLLDSWAKKHMGLHPTTQLTISGGTNPLMLQTQELPAPDLSKLTEEEQLQFMKLCQRIAETQPHPPTEEEQPNGEDTH